MPYLASDLLSSADDPWGTELREQPRSLLILGGGYIALELGQMFARFGTEVTLITRGKSIFSGYEPEIAAALTVILQEEGLRIITGAQARGVKCSEEGIALSVKRHVRTNIPHIWAAGDVIGRESGSQMATPVGARDGKIAAHNALSGEPLREVDHLVIPRAIFTDPQVAVVGTG